ncbi:MAG: hypothetical protein IM613_17425 [Cytophagales bacterium]|nr:hypothetical protein [Cytophagales bacterium]
MYFETKSHQSVDKTNAQEAAAFIRSGDMQTYHAVSWRGRDGNTFFVVPDGHGDNPFLELAVLRKNGDAFTQVESITNGWIDTIDKLSSYLESAEQQPCDMGARNLIIGKPQGFEQAYFICGCCGNDFKSNVLYQHQFDQDDGYGICPRCEHYYC